MRQPRKISHQQLLLADKDHQKAARAAHLLYVNNTMEGITRRKKGNGWIYSYKNKFIKDKTVIGRIKKLAIPPAWKNVWISPWANGHIQATGLDANRRKQYRYHLAWDALRSDTKFHRLYEFGRVLPRLRRKMQKDIRSTELTAEKVLATAISLMERTYIRVGNDDYERLYGSYGLTTLKDKHVTIKKGGLLFSFIGKKGIEHTITLQNKRLARIVKQCRDIPGKELFQYYDAKGKRKSIDSGMLNDYIKKATRMDFSAKDFRTWAGSLQALQCLVSNEATEADADIKKNLLEMLDAVSAKLGNSRNVCKKYYVHPGIIRLYEEKKLPGALSRADSDKLLPPRGLSAEEQNLLGVLKKCF